MLRKEILPEFQKFLLLKKLVLDEWNLSGHKKVETKMINTYIMKDMSNAAKRPLDMLYSKKINANVNRL